MKSLIDLFKKYSSGKEWKNVQKTRENMFVMGAQAILIRNGALLNDFIDSRSDSDWHLLHHDQQKQLVDQFNEHCQSIAFAPIDEKNDALKKVSEFE